MSKHVQVYFRCDPWDVATDSIEAALDRITGEIGVDGLIVTVHTPAVNQLSARLDASPRTVRHAASAMFVPDPRHYGNTRLRPPTPAKSKTGSSLQHFADACEKRSLSLRARVVLCHNEKLAEKFPASACVDAFGDHSPVRLCPSDVDLRHYAAALLDDLSANHALAGIVLSEADFGRASAMHPGRSEPVAASFRSASLCYCVACRRAAEQSGVDITALVDHLTQRDDWYGDTDKQIAPALEHMHRMRVDSVSELLRLARASSAVPVALEIGDHDPHRGIDLGAAAEHIDSWMLQPSPTLPFADEKLRKSLVESAAAAAGVEITLAIGHDRQIAEGAPALVRTASDMVRAGHISLTFDGYGATPEHRFDWVHQAVRFARREVGGG